ncbi:MAG: PPOX class F420-dependent oxidoreductase [Myxococcota bacterium]
MPEAAARPLGREPYVSLATWRRDGRAVETPVWVAEHAGRLYVFSEGDAWKVKRLRRDPRVRVTPCNVRGALRGEPTEGRGRIVEDPETIAAAYEAFRAKYGWQMRLVDGLSRLTGRYDARAMLEIELAEET